MFWCCGFWPASLPLKISRQGPSLPAGSRFSVPLASPPPVDLPISLCLGTRTGPFPRDLAIQPVAPLLIDFRPLAPLALLCSFSPSKASGSVTSLDLHCHSFADFAPFFGQFCTLSSRHYGAAEKRTRHQRVRAQAPREYREQQRPAERDHHHCRQDHPETRATKAETPKRPTRQARACQARAAPCDAPEQPAGGPRCRRRRAQAQVRGRGRGRGGKGKGKEDARQRGPQLGRHPGGWAQVGGRVGRPRQPQGARQTTARRENIHRRRCEGNSRQGAEGREAADGRAEAVRKMARPRYAAAVTTAGKVSGGEC